MGNDPNTSLRSCSSIVSSFPKMTCCGTLTRTTVGEKDVRWINLGVYTFTRGRLVLESCKTPLLRVFLSGVCFDSPGQHVYHQQRMLDPENFEPPTFSGPLNLNAWVAFDEHEQKRGHWMGRDVDAKKELFCDARCFKLADDTATFFQELVWAAPMQTAPMQTAPMRITPQTPAFGFATRPPPSLQNKILVLNGMSKSGKSSTLKIAARLLQDKTSAETATTPWRRVYYFRNAAHPVLGFKNAFEKLQPQYWKPPSGDLEKFFFLLCPSSNFHWEERVSAGFAAVDLPPFNPSLDWEAFARMWTHSPDGELAKAPPELDPAEWFSFVPGRCGQPSSSGHAPTSSESPSPAATTPAATAPAATAPAAPAPAATTPAATTPAATTPAATTPAATTPAATTAPATAAPAAPDAFAPPAAASAASVLHLSQASTRSPPFSNEEWNCETPLVEPTAPLVDAPSPSLADLFLYSNGIIGVAMIVGLPDFFRREPTITMYQEMKRFLTQSDPTLHEIEFLQGDNRHRRRANIEWLVQRRTISLTLPTGAAVDTRFIVPAAGGQPARLGCPFFAQLYMKALDHLPVASSEVTTIDDALWTWSGYPDVQRRICERAVISQSDRLLGVPALDHPLHTRPCEISLEPFLRALSGTRPHPHPLPDPLPRFLHLVPIDPCHPLIDLIRVYAPCGAAISGAPVSALQPTSLPEPHGGNQVTLLVDQITVSRIADRQNSLTWICSQECATVIEGISKAYHCDPGRLRKVFVFIAPDPPAAQQLLLPAELQKAIGARGWEVWWSALQPFLSPTPPTSRGASCAINLLAAPSFVAEIDATDDSQLMSINAEQLRTFAVAKGLKPGTRNTPELVQLIKEWRHPTFTDVVSLKTIIEGPPTKPAEPAGEERGGEATAPPSPPAPPAPPAPPVEERGGEATDRQQLRSSVVKRREVSGVDRARRLRERPRMELDPILAQIAAALREDDAEVLMEKFPVDQLRAFAAVKGLRVPKQRKADLIASLIRDADEETGE
ncbi:hypothetical protein PAPYR_8608 [Paratrimastix pyriformis]|uniref:Rho termination factor N-terminal domain-containing protein n=1 Tax=Paratrimastix pyriformis TaxID=342808 RepID=A0ABQ8UEE9_9EUKA|nr:hypothetical protein PAPYR_8608 [Paratrimastix pyriformis]